VELGDLLSPWLIAPFAVLLLCIAVLPLAAGKWFDRLANKALVAALFGVPVLAYLALQFGAPGREKIVTTAEDYVSFIILLAALFTISGGIYLTGDPLGTPRNNLTFMAVGAVLANFVGTTGAAMLLVRPLLRANSDRTRSRHIFVFLIFIVCNIGGCLTPLGDPPLFLGFLQGIGFFWTLRLFPQWLLATGLVLLVFWLVDHYYWRQEPLSAIVADDADYVPLRLLGKVNLVFLGGVLLAVLASGPLARLGEIAHVPFPRDLILLALIALSLLFGPREPRRMNRFAWGPILEVAIVFAGIFATMVPALSILESRGAELGVTAPWQFFWASGVLSSFLDNAPTYLTFSALAQGVTDVPSAAGLMSQHVVPALGVAPAAFLAAISCGSVFMGANSYIGNAPNFMVRSIVEEHGVQMPNFFHYMAWSGAVLLPIFAIVTLIFFR
jgi:Na+/H+ antiporter NhaD/arsenite permease-like protein